MSEKNTIEEDLSQTQDGAPGSSSSVATAAAVSSNVPAPQQKNFTQTTQDETYFDNLPVSLAQQQEQQQQGSETTQQSNLLTEPNLTELPEPEHQLHQSIQEFRELQDNTDNTDENIPDLVKLSKQSVKIVPNKIKIKVAENERFDPGNSENLNQLSPNPVVINSLHNSSSSNSRSSSNSSGNSSAQAVGNSSPDISPVDIGHGVVNRENRESVVENSPLQARSLKNFPGVGDSEEVQEVRREQDNTAIIGENISGENIVNNAIVANDTTVVTTENTTANTAADINTIVTTAAEAVQSTETINNNIIATTMSSANENQNHTNGEDSSIPDERDAANRNDGNESPEPHARISSPERFMISSPPPETVNFDGRGQDPNQQSQFAMNGMAASNMTGYDSFYGGGGSSGSGYDPRDPRARDPRGGNMNAYQGYGDDHSSSPDVSPSAIHFRLDGQQSKSAGTKSSGSKSSGMNRGNAGANNDSDDDIIEYDNNDTGGGGATTQGVETESYHPRSPSGGAATMPAETDHQQSQQYQQQQQQQQQQTTSGSDYHYHDRPYNFNPFSSLYTGTSSGSRERTPQKYSEERYDSGGYNEDPRSRLQAQYAMQQQQEQQQHYDQSDYQNYDNSNYADNGSAATYNQNQNTNQNTPAPSAQNAPKAPLQRRGSNDSDDAPKPFGQFNKGKYSSLDAKHVEGLEDETSGAGGAGAKTAGAKTSAASDPQKTDASISSPKPKHYYFGDDEENGTGKKSDKGSSASKKTSKEAAVPPDGKSVGPSERQLSPPTGVSGASPGYNHELSHSMNIAYNNPTVLNTVQDSLKDSMSHSMNIAYNNTTILNDMRGISAVTDSYHEGAVSHIGSARASNVGMIRSGVGIQSPRDQGQDGQPPRKSEPVMYDMTRDDTVDDITHMNRAMLDRMESLNSKNSNNASYVHSNFMTSHHTEDDDNINQLIMGYQVQQDYDEEMHVASQYGTEPHEPQHNYDVRGSGGSDRRSNTSAGSSPDIGDGQHGQIRGDPRQRNTAAVEASQQDQHGSGDSSSSSSRQATKWSAKNISQTVEDITRPLLYSNIVSTGEDYAAVSNVDEFLTHLYKYYEAKGFAGIIWVDVFVLSFVKLLDCIVQRKTDFQSDIQKIKRKKMIHRSSRRSLCSHSSSRIHSLLLISLRFLHKLAWDICMQK